MDYVNLLPRSFELPYSALTFFPAALVGMNWFGWFHSQKGVASDERARAEQFEAVSQKYELTPREQDVVRLILQGRTNQQIADELGVTVSPIKKHITKINQKCELKSRQDLIALFSYSADDLAD